MEPPPPAPALRTHRPEAGAGPSTRMDTDPRRRRNHPAAARPEPDRTFVSCSTSRYRLRLPWSVGRPGSRLYLPTATLVAALLTEPFVRPPMLLVPPAPPRMRPGRRCLAPRVPPLGRRAVVVADRNREN